MPVMPIGRGAHVRRVNRRLRWSHRDLLLRDAVENAGVILHAAMQVITKALLAHACHAHADGSLFSYLDRRVLSLSDDIVRGIEHLDPECDACAYGESGQLLLHVAFMQDEIDDYFAIPFECVDPDHVPVLERI